MTDIRSPLTPETVRQLTTDALVATRDQCAAELVRRGDAPGSVLPDRVTSAQAAHIMACTPRAAGHRLAALGWIRSRPLGSDGVGRGRIWLRPL
jgi:hypothetical protein